ncbi:hypothetical protein HHK36_021728 [Tetracentron sinense]|uniref:Uncharacterized protein n=1 Tax=Tetracentron sinense TaxID=13715 RepID=A0A835DAX2_TETSI|nr:hypothetical protein HHK36_021728 [Tetracentron sinense]
MEGLNCRVSLIALMAVVFAVLSLIGDSHAAEAPAPSPTSAAGALSPSAAAAFLVALLLGIAFRLRIGGFFMDLLRSLTSDFVADM